MSATPTIDVHAHAIFPQLGAAVARLDPEGLAAHQALEALRNGPESLQASGAMVGARMEQLTVLSRRLSDMDRTGIDVQVVSPSPSHYYPFLAAEAAVEVAQLANTAVRDLVAEAPDRLVGLGLIALQHPHLAVALLEHAVLECGLRGVEISSFAPDPAGGHPIDLSDERLEPFWARAVELDAVVFLHPFGCSLDERLDRFYLSNTVGQPAENAVALSQLIFSGVLDRHPDLVLIASHGGGYLPTYIGRSDHAWRARPEAKVPKNAPSTYLRMLYFDSLVHSAAGLAVLVDAVGADRVVLGSDYPFDMGTDDPLADLRGAGLDEATSDAIAGATALILRLGIES
ncbi:amidohydrolase family protein [Subtercola sp. YIM 133946]|uniref:amidohydrolase family protein n=1 Tax=Subtercola sp. YIM 133946 TaxID=3118909 RepID=UPI002F95D881